MKTKGINLIVAFILISVLSACSMIKSPQSANFHKVKYNSHLKLNKQLEHQELEETNQMALMKSKKELNSQSVQNEVLPKADRSQPAYAFSNELLKENDKRENDTENLKASIAKESEANKKGFIWTPIDGYKESLPAKVNAPLGLDSGDGLGNLLYLLLVIILILIIISLIADLAGGLIGALIAVLLILLILRLLGYA